MRSEQSFGLKTWIYDLTVLCRVRNRRCPEQDSNLHDSWPGDFKSPASTIPPSGQRFSILAPMALKGANVRVPR